MPVRATWLALPFSLCLLARAEAGEIVLRPVAVAETKAVFGKVETRDVVATRARIGGTLVSISVSEGDAVTQGQQIALVADDKLALQLNAADARIRALTSEESNSRTELERARELLGRGATTQQRVDQLRTQVDVLRNQIAAAQADRAVIVQQSAEGAVTAPATGRVLTKTVTRGTVIMPGEAVATIAGGGFFLRLALPERHAPMLEVGAAVPVQVREGGPTTIGKLVKVFPLIDNGRVIADVEVEALGDFFVGARVLVHVPIGTRMVLAVPAEALMTRAGIDFVRIAGPSGASEVTVVPGEKVDTPAGSRIEILTGLKAGDRVVTP